MLGHLQRPIALLMAFWMVILPLAPAQAAMVGNEQLIGQSPTELSRDDIQRLLARDSAQQQLRALGVDPGLVKERIERLTDTEVARINQGLEQAAAGSGIIELLVLLFVVFIITDVIGATDIFPFIHPVK